MHLSSFFLPYPHKLQHWLQPVALLAYLFSAFPFYRIHGHSMQPTVHDGDLMLGERLPFLDDRVRRGDIVTVVNPLQPHTNSFLKRVAYLPHEIVFSSDHPISLPAKHYYVLGDNRAFSLDSRDLGPVSLEARAIALYCPHHVCFRSTRSHLPEP